MSSKKAHLVGALRAGIDSGQWGPGDRLPSASELAKEHGVSEHTVREALGVLKTERLIEGVAGAGTFVLDRVKPAGLPSAGQSVEERLAALEAWRAAHEERHP